MLQAMDPNAKVDTTRFEIETDALNDLLIKAFGMLPECYRHPLLYARAMI